MRCRKVKEILLPMRKINEIFLSLQGEGCHTGVPSIFIRFSGCNLHCGFCDTDHLQGEWMTDESIIDQVKQFDAAQIVLTGGEPALQTDHEFIKKLKEATRLRIAIETNGTHPLPEGIDWITVSPKEGMSEYGDASLKVIHADELKVVDVNQDLAPYFKLGCVDDKTIMLLQPCYVTDARERELNLHRTINRVLEDPRWRLSLQTHRLLGIR